MIEVSRLRKQFGPIVAVDDISFRVEKGEVLGFLGPNGAGKSTTMKMIAGFLTPTRGTANVCGFDVVEQPIEVKSRIGYLPEGAPAYADMTAWSFLRFAAEIRGFRGADRDRRVDLAVEQTQLAEVLYQSIDTLSKGYKRRVGLAQAFLHDPEVLILDEPTDGLDPNQKHEVRTLIRGMAPEKVTIVSTHILEEVTAVCTRATVIARGRLVADGTPEELETSSRFHNAVVITAESPAVDAIRQELLRQPSIALVEEARQPHGIISLTAFPKDGRSIIADVGQIVREGNWEVQELHVLRGHLDEVFRNITQPSD